MPTNHTAALMQVTAGACPSTGVTSWPLMVMTPAESTSAWMTGWVKAMPRRSGVIFCMAVSFFGDASGRRRGGARERDAPSLRATATAGDAAVLNPRTRPHYS
ncbi:hypothetical protein [Actinomyces denticolens]|uniref:hypothetical protein n=1 Tax=Actinomyces denticolens TaxID=52767 RepID=UPI0011786549|nr:hypothetical protein [Actinomyces denticolens]